ncbi:hypothetical protein TRICI_005881 [Trichomonascus ciferrii]|uniref:Uncharacterized protein n=1 Tax=Trichomonascus ciferrii TaxID=44093 RepID=A0A642UTE1_9ASCO|nr:hypothetical protein TRICI_005881 [Trichomonascus ciferrii]
MGIVYHHHIHHETRPSESISFSTPTVVKREEKTCGPDDDSGVCEKPVHSQGLPIGLGVGIPVAIAIAVLIYLHYRHVKKLKKEEEKDRDIDVDIDMEDYNPSEIKKKMDQARDFDNDEEDQHPVMQEKFNPKSVASDDPFYATMPYISHPDFAGSKTSLEEYSRSLNSVYDQQHTASVYGGSIPRYPSPARLKNDLTSPIGRVPSNSSTSQSFVSAHGSTPAIGMIHEEKTASSGTHKSPFDDNPDSSDDDSSTDGEVDHSFHNRMEEKLAAGIEDIERSSSRQTANNGNNTNNDGNFALFDDDNETTNNHNVNLSRKDTGHYNRVKSFYREYMPEEEIEKERLERERLEQERLEQERLEQERQEQERLEQERQERERREQERFEQERQEQVRIEQERQDHARFEQELREQERQQAPQNEPEALQHNPVGSKPPFLQLRESLVQPRGQANGENNWPLNEPANEQRTQTMHSRRFTDDGSVYSATIPTMPDHPDDLFPKRGHPSNASEYSDYRPDSQFPPSISQQGHRPPPAPLPKLSDLPTPHSLSETESPIAFAPQNRYKGASSPKPPTTQAFNPLTDWAQPSVQSSSGALPSPHALRQSLVLMSAVDFAPPKKFSNAAGRARSSSTSNVSMGSHSPITPQSPALSSARGSYNTGNKGLSSPSLVPDKGNSDMLKPTMDMRS